MSEPRSPLRLLWLAAAAPPPPEVARVLEQALWQVLHLDHSTCAAAWVRRLTPDAVVMQMQASDTAALITVRAVTTAPILVLTAAHQEHAQLRLFQAGADAVLHSASSAGLLLARLRALQRLRPPPQASSVHVGDLLVPPLARGARWGGQTLDLSPTEQALLHELVRRQGRAVTRGALDACLARRQRQRHQRTVDVLISRLRLRLKEQAVHDVQIRAVPGVGYCLTTLAAAAGAT